MATVVPDVGLEELKGVKLNSIIAVASVFLALSWIAVSLRVYTRAFRIRSFGVDDWLMVITLGCFTSLCSILIVFGYKTNHTESITIPFIKNTFEYFVYTIAFYLCSQVILKLSLAVFLLRIVQEKWQRQLIYISMIVYVLFAIPLLFIGIYSCGKPGDILENRLKGNCMHWNVLGPLNYVSGSLNAITDWIFAIIPFFVLRKSSIPRQAKYAVWILMALGSLGGMASLARMKFVRGLNPYGPKFFLHVYDVAVLSVIEPGIGIIAASGSTLRPLLRLILEKTRGTDGIEELPRDESQEGKTTNKPHRDEFAQYGFQSTDLESWGNSTVVSTPFTEAPPGTTFGHPKSRHGSHIGIIRSLSDFSSSRSEKVPQEHTIQY